MWQKVWQDKRIVGGLLVLLILLVAVPLTLQQSQKPQDIRQHAASGPVCGQAPTDTMLLIDKSNSMNDPTSSTDSTTKFTRAKQAAVSFAQLIQQKNASLPADKQQRVGVVSFANASTPKGVTQINSPLTSDMNSVISAINAIQPGNDLNGHTCLQCGINQTDNEFQAHGRAGVQKVGIIMTDGVANWTETSTTEDKTAGEQSATQAINTSYNTYHTEFFTIGLGADVNQTYLQNIAAKTGAQYYFSPDANKLSAIYSQISDILGKGVIKGKVFNDKNNNNTFDSNEPGLSGWKIDLKDAQGVQKQASTSASDGSYLFQAVCDGTYQVTETVQSGWSQTTPTNPSYFTPLISNGNTVANLNFGNYRPEDTKVSLTLFMHGIGHSGDNANPHTYTLSNQDPLHTSRPATVQVFNEDNTLVANKSGTVQYNKENGNFTGNVDLGTRLPSGPYTVKIKSDRYLYRQLPGIVKLVTDQENSFQTDLVTGDVNQDNVLNILDYNLIIGCYSDFQAAVACNPTLQNDTDLTDDGHVNQYDYNLFLRDLSVQNGD